MIRLAFLFKIIVSGFLLINSANAQQNDFVAKSGNKVISAEEFKLRYELMPIVSVNINEDSLKHELLYTLISEMLMAKKAESLGFDQMTRFTDIYIPLEKMFVRDALFKEEIEKKIKITRPEFRKAVEKAKYQLKLNIINSLDSAEIYNIHSQLIKGALFDSLLRTRREYKDQESPFTISFGSIEEEYVEDAIFSLIPGKYSVPLRTKDGWFIFYLHEKLRVNENEEVSKIESDVKKIIKEKKSRTAGLAYMKEILGSVRVNADTAAFWKIVEMIAGELQKKGGLSNKPANDFIWLTEQDISVIKNKLGADTLKMILVPFDKHPSSINDFLNRYYHIEFKTKKTDNRQIAYKVSYDLHSFIESEVLAQEGYRRGYNKLPEVQRDLEMWKESFLSQMYRNSYIAGMTANDTEVLEFYNELYNSNQPVMHVKIIEVLSSDLSVIETVLDQVKNGKDFKDLADALSDVNKEPEFFPVTQRGDIGKIAGGLNIGDLYGPMRTENGYLLIKLIDKKEEKQTPPQSYDDIKEKLRMDLLNKKLDKILTSKTAELSGKYPTIINEKALSLLKLTSMNMFTYRYMGFGGRISAVPYSYPFHNWIKEAENIKKILP